MGISQWVCGSIVLPRSRFLYLRLVRRRVPSDAARETTDRIFTLAGRHENNAKSLLYYMNLIFIRITRFHIIILLLYDKPSHLPATCRSQRSACCRPIVISDISCCFFLVFFRRRLLFASVRRTNSDWRFTTNDYMDTDHSILR